MTDRIFNKDELSIMLTIGFIVGIQSKDFDGEVLIFTAEEIAESTSMPIKEIKIVLSKMEHAGGVFVKYIGAKKYYSFDNKLGLNIPQGYIYFIQSENGGPIKIGYAKDVNKRLSQLQTGNHNRLKLLASIRGDYGDEQKTHKMFSEHRIGGEWFNPCTEITDYINKCICNS